MGTVPARRITVPRLTPASSGVHGPGEMTMPWGIEAAIPPTS